MDLIGCDGRKRVDEIYGIIEGVFIGGNTWKAKVY